MILSRSMVTASSVATISIIAASVSALCLGLSACGGSMQMHKPEQGLQGVFSTYGPPAVIRDCNPFVTQSEKDSCRHNNERVIDEPYQGSFEVRNLSTRVTLGVTLDTEGKYRLPLTPGEYEICVGGECSDPITIRMGAFEIYGQRLPRALPDPAVAGNPMNPANPPNPHKGQKTR